MGAAGLSGRRTERNRILQQANKRVAVPMMHGSGRLGYLDGGTFDALELPYAGNALSMVILLPRKPDGLAEFEAGLSAKGLTDSLAGLRPRRVDVAIDGG